jgi:hypothetical protein
MTNTELDKYKVDHLFLLIGENPLPNYVAAHLLLNKGGTLYLVHTTGTSGQAIRLKNILQSEVSVCKTAEPISLGEYDSDAFHIQDEIRKVAKNLPKSDSLGLHYTGGTKAMSIHAYGAMLSLDRSDVVFSYLDPRRLEVCIDRKDDGRIHHNVAIAVKPSLEKVFQLHGKVCEKTPIQEVKLPDFAKKLAILHSDEQKSKDWFKWFYDEICCENLRKKKGNGDWGDWRGKQILEKLEISISNLPQEAIDGFIEHGFISSEGLLSFAKVHETQKFAKLEHFCEWLGGLWLEYQVLQVIKDISGNRLIHDYGMDFKVPTGSGKNFQFDVAFMRGYQLFAISCTTSAKDDLCKLKLFEARTRALQLGGSGARVALVCCSNNPENLKIELRGTTEDSKIEVFGREDLPNLREKFNTWITEQEKKS